MKDESFYQKVHFTTFAWCIAVFIASKPFLWKYTNMNGIRKYFIVNTDLRENMQNFLLIYLSVTNFFIDKEMIEGNFKDTSVKLQVWSRVSHVLDIHIIVKY